MIAVDPKASVPVRQRSRLAGWLIELGVVAVILAGLAAVAAARFRDALDRANDNHAYPIQTDITDEIR